MAHIAENDAVFSRFKPQVIDITRMARLIGNDVVRMLDQIVQQGAAAST
jgi:hypothetical protein